MKTAGQSRVSCTCAPVADAEYSDENDGSPVTVIVETLAEVAGTEQTKLAPLYEFVDPDAINALIERRGGAEGADALISFRVDTWNVFVRADGRIRVCDATTPVDPEPVFERSLYRSESGRSGALSGEAPDRAPQP